MDFDQIVQTVTSIGIAFGLKPSPITSRYEHTSKSNPTDTRIVNPRSASNHKKTHQRDRAGKCISLPFITFTRD